MSIVPTLYTIDPLGKIDSSTMSQQTLMRIFIQGISNKERICGTSESIADISRWNGVYLNDAHEVTDILWTISYALQGTISLRWLPHTVLRLHVFRIGSRFETLTGSLDLCALPNDFHDPNLFSNRFFGDVNLTCLPSAMDSLCLSSNDLTWSLNFEVLPDTLTNINIQNNTFSGTVCLTKLPQSLQTINIADNRLFGTLNLRNIPKTLQEMLAHKNKFEGETDFSRLPESLFWFNIADNPGLSGEILDNGDREVTLKRTKVRFF